MSKITRETLTDIETLFHQGCKTKQIAENLGIHINSVYTLLHVLGLRQKDPKTGTSIHLPSEESILKKIAIQQKRLEMLRLYKNGWTFDKIGEKYGYSRQYVYMFLRGGQSSKVAAL